MDKISSISAANSFTEEYRRNNSPAQLSASLPLTFPPVLLIHGDLDVVAPLQNSKDFHNILCEAPKLKEIAMMERLTICRPLEIVDEVGHNDLVLEIWLGGKTQAMICDWIGSIIEL